MPTKVKPCRLCDKKATRGCYTWKDPNGDKWLTACLCEDHGQIALSKGAKKLAWRPNDTR